jgi:hypothetical protein
VAAATTGARSYQLDDLSLGVLIGIDVSVTRRLVCPASFWTSLSEPPTRDIFLAAFVMKVRLPLWLEHPWKPICSYQRANMFTMT